MKERDPRTVTETPPVVTFATGAKLLMRLGLCLHMTREGVRRIAYKHPDWPFGIDREYPYWEVARADVMETEPFLEFFQKHPIVGRGPDKAPRGQRKGEL